MNLADLFEEIRKIPINEVMIDLFPNSWIKKRKNGRQSMLCPFHNEKTPSFFSYPVQNAFCCYGCGVGGGSIYLSARGHGLSPNLGIQYKISYRRERILTLNYLFEKRKLNPQITIPAMLDNFLRLENENLY